MSQKLVVVVAGGTGKQGGAVVKSLLEQGHTWGISRTMFGIRRVRGGCSPSVGCNYYSVSASDADWTSSEHLHGFCTSWYRMFMQRSSAVLPNRTSIEAG